MTTLDPSDLEPDDDDDVEIECGCDFVETVEVDGERFELHHVIPDDSAPHSPSTECGCGPDIERVEYDLIVVDHRDQDGDPALQGEATWPLSGTSTGDGPAPSSPGSC